MIKSISLKIAAGVILIAGAINLTQSKPANDQVSPATPPPVVRVSSQITTPMNVVQADFESDVIRDPNIQLCQGFGDIQQPGSPCGCNGGCDTCQQHSSPTPLTYGAMPNHRNAQGVNQYTDHQGRTARWRDKTNVPWEAFAYGEYLGPHRTPHVPEYRLRVNDQLEFVYLKTREKSLDPYQLYVGDQIQISSAIDPTLNQPDSSLRNGMTIRSDGMVSLSLIGQIQAAGKTVEDLQRELNEKYTEFVKNPAIVVQVTQGDTPLQDLVDSVDARAGQGGQGRQATVSPDGTVQLPGIGSIPAVGLTLNEMALEVNARYRLRQGGIEVTPILTQRAPRFIYVVGEVAAPGRFELVGPTSVIQALSLAQGENLGGNLRQVIIFRRDQNWRLTATKLDLKGAMLGKQPFPSDEIWLRDSDIILIPKKPIQRLSEAVNLYLEDTLYSIFPQQGVAFDFDGFTTF